jgi:hypothetical protein
MRRILFVPVLGLIGTAAILARGGGGGHGGGGMHAGGGGMHAGGGVRGGVAGGFRGGAPGGFRGGAPGALRGGTAFRGGVGFRGNVGFRNNFVFRGTRFVGFSPFFYSGFYGGGYPFWDPFDYSDYGSGVPDSGYAYPDYGYASYGYPYDGSYISNSNWYPAPQSYAPPPPPAPVIREYTGPATQAQGPPTGARALPPGAPSLPPGAPALPQGAPSNEPPLYLVAFQDGVIRAALAYWVDGATLHYVDLDHVQKQVALASVDRGLSDRLNRERRVDFRLPR